MDASSFWIEEPGRGAIRRRHLPDPGPGEARIRTLFSGISRGSESLVFKGRVPESQHLAMRAPFQEGEFPAPVKYGYMAVGQVEIGPDEWPGRIVFCLYPHQDRFVVPTSALRPLPEGLPAERAVLAANMETAVNGLWDAMPGPGDRVVVIGGGVVGLLQAWLCRQIPGTDVTLVDSNPRRAAVAATLGLPFSLPEQAPGEADLVIHASGQPAGLRQALALAGLEAMVLEMSWYGEQSVAAPLGEAFHARRLTIRSSQVGRLPASRLARWDHERRMQLALRLLRDPVLDVLITGESPFEELPSLMPTLADPGDTLCHRIRYPSGESDV